MTQAAAPRVAVVGGGMAGLAAALRLLDRARVQGAPLSVTVLEADAVLGGKVRTDRQTNLLIEQGPDALSTQKPYGAELARRLDLGEHLVEPAAERTYVAWGGRLQPMPAGLVLGVPVTWAGLWRSPWISFWGKLRASLEPWVPPRRVGVDESIAQFLRRRLGREVADRLTGPLLAGIASGDPERLSMEAVFPQLRRLEQEAGSLVRGLRRRRRAGAGGPEGARQRTAPYQTLRGGLDRLPAAAAHRIHLWGGQLRVGVAVRRLEAEAGGYRLTADGGGSESFDGVVLAVPAWAAARLLEPLVPDAAGELAAIPYKSTLVVALAYPQEAVGPLEGSGFLVPVSEPFFITGCTWLSAKWPHTAPPGTALLRAFVGRWGDDDAELLALDDGEVVERVRRDLAELMGIGVEPLLARIYRWPRGMPQYQVGHLDRLARITAALQEHPRLVLAGAGYRGVSVPDCVRQGQEAADRLWNVLRPAAAAHSAGSS